MLYLYLHVYPASSVPLISIIGVIENIEDPDAKSGLRLCCSHTTVWNIVLGEKL